MHVPGAHDALEFELQLVELLTMWMLGVESRFSRKSSQYSSNYFTVYSPAEKLIFSTPTRTQYWALNLEHCVNQASIMSLLFFSRLGTEPLNTLRKHSMTEPSPSLGDSRTAFYC